MNILVSACLLGVNCKYNGNNNLNEAVAGLLKRHVLIPVCPEQMGGLITPRSPSEISGENVLSKDGNNVTEQYRKGAMEALKLAGIYGCECAVLKERSPSCGVNYIYDGSFSKTLVNGMGITARLLRENGIKLYSEENIHELL